MTHHQSFIPAGSTVGNGLDAQTAFVTLALLNTMRSAFRLIPSCITAFSQSSVSIKRIDEFLNSEDNLVPIQTPGGGFSGNNNGSGNGIRLLQPSLSNNDERKDNLQVASRNGSQANGSVPPNVAIYLKNCWFTMKNSGNRSGLCTPTPTPTIPCAPSPFTNLAPGGAGSALLSPPPLQLPDVTLRDVSMTVEKGAIIGIVGGMASGKTTLISALMGEMRKTRGTFVLEDQVIIAPNSPWMKSGTIKDNILFGTPSAGGEAGEAASTNPNSEPAKGKLYDKVIRECGL